MDLALNNLQRLICHKTQTSNQPTNNIYILVSSVSKQKNSKRSSEYQLSHDKIIDLKYMIEFVLTG